MNRIHNSNCFSVHLKYDESHPGLLWQLSVSDKRSLLWKATSTHLGPFSAFTALESGGVDQSKIADHSNPHPWIQIMSGLCSLLFVPSLWSCQHEDDASCTVDSRNRSPTSVLIGTFNVIVVSTKFTETKQILGANRRSPMLSGNWQLDILDFSCPVGRSQIHFPKFRMQWEVRIPEASAD